MLSTLLASFIASAATSQVTLPTPLICPPAEDVWFVEDEFSTVPRRYTARVRNNEEAYGAQRSTMSRLTATARRDRARGREPSNAMARPQVPMMLTHTGAAFADHSKLENAPPVIAAAYFWDVSASSDLTSINCRYALEGTALDVFDQPVAIGSLPPNLQNCVAPEEPDYVLVNDQVVENEQIWIQGGGANDSFYCRAGRVACSFTCSNMQILESWD